MQVEVCIPRKLAQKSQRMKQLERELLWLYPSGMKNHSLQGTPLPRQQRLRNPQIPWGSAEFRVKANGVPKALNARWWRYEPLLDVPHFSGGTES